MYCLFDYSLFTPTAVITLEGSDSESIPAAVAQKQSIVSRHSGIES